MLELFKHIIHLDFEWLFQNYNNTVYTILFLVIFIETGLVLMPFLPGDSLLFTAGLFANQINSVTGEPFLNLGYLLVLLLIAAIVGDNVNYWVGRKIGLKMLKIKFRGKNLVKEEYLTKTHAFYEKYGPKTIIMARFVPIVRTFAPFVAGVAEMNYKKFLSFDVLGGVLWIFSLTLAGYFLGEIPWIRNNIEKVALGIIFISILPIIIEILKVKMAKK
ncbi:MAG: VTT domain-containing protein [Bacteroidota bacterium]|nr:VTT domain-containing protein [Bacteroidia bacterium]MDP1746086.1 VTT domain-containing protein [Bacteroidota bacterium]